MMDKRAVQALVITALGLSIARAATGQPVRAGANPAEETTTKMRHTEPADSLPNPAFVARWAMLTASLLDEFKRDHRSPIGNIEGDFSTLEMKIRLASSREDAWVSRTFTTSELLSADPKAMAKALYAEARRKL